MIDMCLWSGDKQTRKIAKALKFKFEKEDSYEVYKEDIESPGIDKSMFNPLGLDIFKLPIHILFQFDI